MKPQKLTLQQFMPPIGTLAPPRPLSPRESKLIGKKLLADEVMLMMIHAPVGTFLKIRSHGRDHSFKITGANDRRYIWINGDFKTPDQFIDHLIKFRTPTEILRLHKLIVKSRLDRKSRIIKSRLRRPDNSLSELFD